MQLSEWHTSRILLYPNARCPKPCPSAAAGAVVALFLALTAVHFVVSQHMPASSYVTAMGELIIFSYVVLIVDGIETILVYNLSISCARRKRCGTSATRGCALVLCPPLPLPSLLIRLM